MYYVKVVILNTVISWKGSAFLFELDSSPSPVFHKILLFLDVIFLSV